MSITPALHQLTLSKLQNLEAILEEVANQENNLQGTPDYKSQVNISILGVRTVTFQNREFTLSELTQKINDVRQEHLSQEVCIVANKALRHLENIRDISDKHLKGKSRIAQWATKFFLLLRSCFDSQSWENMEHRMALTRKFNLVNDMVQQPKTGQAVWDAVEADGNFFERLDERLSKRCFIEDPITNMLFWLIDDLICGTHDSAAIEFIISKIDGFADIVLSDDYLEAFADHYFAYQPTQCRATFDAQLKTPRFQDLLTQARNEKSPEALRNFFAIFPIAEEKTTSPQRSTTEAPTLLDIDAKDEDPFALDSDEDQRYQEWAQTQ